MSKISVIAAFFAVVRVLAVFVALLLTAVVTQGLSAEQAGYFLLGFTLVTRLSAFLRLAQDNVLVRAFGTDDMAQLSLTTLFALGCFGLSGCWGGLACVFSSNVALSVFGKLEFAGALFWMMLALPLEVLFNLCSLAFQGSSCVVIWFQQLGAGFTFVPFFGLAWWQLSSWLSSSCAAYLFFRRHVWWL